MKAIRKTSRDPLSPVGMSRWFHDDTAQRLVLRGSDEWSDEATASRLLDALLHDLSGTCCGPNLTAEDITMSGCPSNQIDGLIYMSAEMRGLIFQAYARRITDLMIAGSAVCGRPTKDRRLN